MLVTGYSGNREKMMVSRDKPDRKKVRDVESAGKRAHFMIL